MSNLSRIFGAALGLLVLASPASSQGVQGFKVIVHASNPISSMTSSEISNLFLKRVTRWRNGQGVVPVDLSANSAVRDDFSDAVHGRDASAVKAYWTRQIFSGRRRLSKSMAVVRCDEQPTDAVLVICRTACGAEKKLSQAVGSLDIALLGGAFEKRASARSALLDAVSREAELTES